MLEKILVGAFDVYVANPIRFWMGIAMDVVLGQEEDFDYVSTTCPLDPPPAHA